MGSEESGEESGSGIGSESKGESDYWQTLTTAGRAALNPAFKAIVGFFSGLTFWTMSVAAIDLSGVASDFCGAEEYQLLAGIIVAGIGLGLMAIIAGGSLGAGAFSLSWVSRSLAQMGGAGLVKGIGGGIGLMIFFFIVGMAFSIVSIPIPTECYMPLS